MRHLFDLPHREIRALLERGAPVYLLVNPVEYHGPHLSLHNDRLISLGLARDLHARLQEPLGEHPLLLADDLEAGVDPCPGPGTRFDALPSVRARVVEACERLADLGARRVVLVTFHGSPLHSVALHAGVRALARRDVIAVSPLDLVLDDLIAGDTRAVHEAFQAIADEEVRAGLIADATCDFHAGFFETSLSLHYAPDTVAADLRSLPPCPVWTPDRGFQRLSRVAAGLGRARLAAELAFVADGLGWYALRPFPGYTGRPDLANPDAGALFAGALLERYTAHALDVFAGAPPAAPALPWLARITLDGRLGGAPRSVSYS